MAVISAQPKSCSKSPLNVYLHRNTHRLFCLNTYEGDSPDEDEDDDDADDFNEDFLSAEEAEDDFNSDVLDDDNNDNQGGNKEDGSERSQDQDDQDLFDEFSDSLTELRVGKKLYQSGEECSGGTDDETGGEAKSMGDDDWSCFSYVE
ncbi:Oidioi.mRNA.OKI2018_I69.XSR.g15895.t1.cds [Oikopleura dioica]|uniref:Oidioi.mRNA.OKI2018_I69.XSR.g15895.t1.cds n=1 Tax=Oikopleura dioica TaxID=34765 RepID=A0ABN7SJF6_OIKDI|nr:Oidioi.mRNA.OKI2018_I69.XSR.g15895.t1.cds [Oikopleura dioica]